MKAKGFTSIILASLLSLACAGKTNADPQSTKDPKDPGMADMAAHAEVVYKDTTVKDFHIMWRTDTLGLLHVKVETAGTGWVAVGFSPSNIMKDANIIMGYVKADTAYVSDEFGVALTSHKPDASLGGKDDIREKSGMEKDGKTMIHFAIPLDSKDAYDKVLEPGKTYKVIVAAGSSDNFTSPHVKTASLMLTI